MHDLLGKLPGQRPGALPLVAAWPGAVRVFGRSALLPAHAGEGKEKRRRLSKQQLLKDAEAKKHLGSTPEGQASTAPPHDIAPASSRPANATGASAALQQNAGSPSRRRTAKCPRRRAALALASCPAPTALSVPPPWVQAQLEKEAWKAALARSQGDKVLDDPRLLKKSIKKARKTAVVPPLPAACPALPADPACSR